MTEQTCPTAGDIVLVTMPKDWHPELSIREYPAIVVYQTNDLTFKLDVQVFAGAHGVVYYGWVGRSMPNTDHLPTWRHRD